MTVLHDGRLSAPFTFAGVSIRARIVVDEAERRRRRVFHDIDEVPIEALEAFFLLPEGVQVPDASLPRWAERALERAPDWTHERGHGWWERVYRPAGQVTSVVVADRSMPAADQLGALRPIRTLAPCSVVASSADGAVEGLDVAVANGMGIAVAETDDSWWTLVAPSAMRVRLTAERWWLAERAADLLRGSNGSQTSRPWLLGHG